MSVCRVIRRVSGLIPSCRLLLKPARALESTTTRTTFDLQHYVSLPRILPAANYSTESQVEGKHEYIQMRGVPFSANNNDVKEFLSGIDVHDIIYQNENGRFSGNLVVKISCSDVAAALEKDRCFIGSRYVLVNQCTEIMKRQLESSIKDFRTGEEDGVAYIKLEGLPFRVTEEEIRTFLSDVDVHSISYDMKSGLFTGTAVVKISRDDLLKACDKHNNYIGSRYVNVFECREKQVDYMMESNVDAEDLDIPEGMTYVSLVGVPFTVGHSEIANFLGVPASKILIGHTPQGVHNGVAYCLISEEDLPEVLKKDKEYLGNRYVDIRRTPLDKLRYVKLAKAYLRDQRDNACKIPETTKPTEY
ncbi:epithelial splicing regulatory protein 2-like [Ylistrum balloti]|uniref:epithelial splicing regulatory protein 2-like n=1 Tax=Ylistrum balloti TaxID=509963 RepID=UPI002905823D|nr:epithelial splicing regulatory protein 2-like [Ylistrum balloti]